jgi:hypothetical protein
MRSPRELTRQLGWRGLLGLILFIGGTPFLAILNPVFWGLTALWWLDRPEFVSALFPPALLYVGMATWVLGGLALVYSGVANARISGKPYLVLSALLVPVYWAMLSLVAVKALIQLVRNPSYWEKTTHGLAPPPKPVAVPASTDGGD